MKCQFDPLWLGSFIVRRPTLYTVLPFDTGTLSPLYTVITNHFPDPLCPLTSTLTRTDHPIRPHSCQPIYSGLPYTYDQKIADQEEIAALLESLYNAYMPHPRAQESTSDPFTYYPTLSVTMHPLMHSPVHCRLLRAKIPSQPRPLSTRIATSSALHLPQLSSPL